MGLPIYNKLMEPMKLNARQKDEFLSRPFVELGGEFPFPEDMLPKHAKADSKVPLMTLVSSLKDVLRSGGDFTLVRRLWGYFLASLGGREPDFTLQWSRTETVVSDCSVRTNAFLSYAMLWFCLFDYLICNCMVEEWCIYVLGVCFSPSCVRVLFHECCGSCSRILGSFVSILCSSRKIRRLNVALSFFGKRTI